jgi:vancomycin resistance protein VanJ
MMGFRLQVPASEPERGDLRVMTFNVHRQHVDPSRVADYLASVNPDVIAFQDWSSADDELLLGSGRWHVCREGELLVASHFAIGKVTPLNFGDGDDFSKAERGVAATFELLLPGGPINLINVHLASPHTGLLTVLSDRGMVLEHNSSKRWRESEMLRDLVDRTSEPLILAGDFNTADDSPIFRSHWADFTDAFDDSGWGFGYTYVVKQSQMRIDHILARPSWRPIRCWVGPEAGSPHRPLLADLMFR